MKKQTLAECEEITNCTDDKKREELEQELLDSILSVDRKQIYDILLYYGGPAGGFRVVCDKENYLTDVFFWHSE